MKKERKLGLLSEFPPVPAEPMEQMTSTKRYIAQNFVVFLTNGDELFARCYHKYYSGELVERQRYVFAKDGCCRYGADHQGKWTVRTEFREPVFCATSYGYNFDNSYTVLNRKAIGRSCMRYSCAERYCGTLMIEYLGLYVKHPNVEYLVKAGYGTVITEEEVGYYSWRPRRKIGVDANIDLKSNNLLKMLGLNRTEFKALKGSENHYFEYVRWRREFPDLKPTELLSLAKAFHCEFSTARKLAGLTGRKPPRIAAYISEQDISLRDYEDYLRQCHVLRYDMCDTAISFPHDFRAMHTRCSEIIQQMQEEENRRKREEKAKIFNENYQLRTELEFHSGEYLIRQPESMDEIVAEGRKLHHCVAGYAVRHAEGTLHILFIRRASDPDTPLYTMELSTSGKVEQVRGLRNCDPTAEAKAFVEQYKQYIEKIFRKKARKTA